jgi:hypothetical protein
LNLADLSLDHALGWREPVAEVAVEKSLDILLFDDVADVGSVCSCWDVFSFDREAGAKLDATLDSGEEEARAERSAAGERVEKANSGVASR